MCGGRGSRLDADVEKPLFEVEGRPMVDYVRDALAASEIETTYAVVSPHAPNTREHLEGDVPLLETAGEGYVPDLLEALESVETPVLSVAADLPLLDADVVDQVLARADGSTTVRVPSALKALLGVSVEDDGDGSDETASPEWVPTGVNVVADDEDTVVESYDARLAVNVNRRSDATVAERLIRAGRSTVSPDEEEVDDGP
jgi:adenosylcobinamide-phosphate guanylyltransferase